MTTYTHTYTDTWTNPNDRNEEPWTGETTDTYCWMCFLDAAQTNDGFGIWQRMTTYEFDERCSSCRGLIPAC